MDWDKIEKARKGLRTCVESEDIGCPLSCPYYEPCMSNPRHIYSPMMNDVLTEYERMMEQLKAMEAAQTARVMTLEELENALDTVVWVEEPEFENFADHYALIMAYSHKVGFVRVSFGFAEMPVDCEYEYEDYGKKWRCWTQRPTDEQRKAVAWG